MSNEHRCFFILDRIDMTLDYFYDRPENFFRSSAIPKALISGAAFQNLSTDAKLCTRILLDRNEPFC